MCRHWLIQHIKHRYKLEKLHTHLYTFKVGGVTRYITKNILVIYKQVFPKVVGVMTYLHTANINKGPSGFKNCKNMCEVYLSLAITMETGIDLLFNGY